MWLPVASCHQTIMLFHFSPFTQPILYATQPSPQFHQNTVTGTIHPEPTAHPTTAYRVGAEGETGHRQSDSRWAGRVSNSLLNHERSQQAAAAGENVQVAQNASYSMGGAWSRSSDFNKDMEVQYGVNQQYVYTKFAIRLFADIGHTRRSSTTSQRVQCSK